MTFAEVKEHICANTHHSTIVCWLSEEKKKIKFGTYVVTGIDSTGNRTIGYVVQIREKWGAFGSTMFFLRDQDGALGTHENQVFWVLTDEQVELVAPYFKTDPVDELEGNPDITYTIRHEQEASGFLVGPENAPSRADSFAVVVTSN